MQEIRQEKSPIKLRISQYLKFKGITSYRFYADSNVTRNVLSQDNGISEENVARFLAYAPDVSYEWLLTGQGKMLKSEISDSHAIGNTAEFPTAGHIAVPIVDVDAAAGFGASNTGYIDKSNMILFPEAMLSHPSAERMCINVKGESMMPTLHDGSQVVVRRLKRAEWSAEIQNNSIYIITDRQGKTYIKRLRNKLKTDGILTLVSDNPNQRKYKPFDLSEEDIHHVWMVELFIADTVVNCADLASTDSEIAKLQDQVAKLTETVEQLVNEHKN